MIGIIGAMDVEVRHLKNKLTDRKDRTVSGIEFASGLLAGKEVVIAKCGIGKVFAAICAEAMIIEFKVDCIINTGVGGTLTDRLSVGDTAISTAVVQHDMDTSALGDPVGMVSGINKIFFPSDPELIIKAEKAVSLAKIKYACGVIASGDRFIGDRSAKEYIAKTFDAIACEMEGGAIGHTAYVNGIPFIVIRAISDSADGSADVDYPTFVARAAANSALITEKLISLI